MIALKRNAQNFPANFTGDTRKAWELELLTAQRDILNGQLSKHNFLSSRWKATKDQLVLESNNKCAYCEVWFKAVAYGDVEHYRPKSKYWWLAYAYWNYLPSCQLCNQKFKRDKFPIQNQKMAAPAVRSNSSDRTLNQLAGQLSPDPVDENLGQAYQDFKDLHEHERPFCINPYLDNPTKYFAYQLDDVLREVELIPLADESLKFIEAAEEVYGLNRKELKELRYKKLYHYRIHRETINTPGVPQRLRQISAQGIQMLKHQSAPFSGMIIYFETQDQFVPVPLDDTFDVFTDDGQPII